MRSVSTEHQVRDGLADADRGDDDDPALVGLLEVRQRRLDEADRAHQREPVGGVPVLQGGALEVGRRRTARVDDQDVKTAKRRRRGLDRAFRPTRN